MANPKTYQILTWISLALGIVITSDTFLLPKTKMMEVLDNGTTERTRTSSSKGYHSYYFLTTAGNKYHVPEYLYNAVLIGDTFQVHKSLLFRKPVQLSWCRKDGRCYTFDIGVINSNYIGYGVMGYLIIYPLLVLLGIVKITPNKKTNVYICFTVALGTLIFYLVY